MQDERMIFRKRSAYNLSMQGEMMDDVDDDASYNLLMIV